MECFGDLSVHGPKSAGHVVELGRGQGSHHPVEDLGLQPIEEGAPPRVASGHDEIDVALLQLPQHDGYRLSRDLEESGAGEDRRLRLPDRSLPPAP